MICIYCFHKKTSVVNSRTHKKQPQVWRRRQCKDCGKLFTSYERPDSSDIIVRYTDATQQPFTLGALVLSIAKAAQHNPEQARYDSYALALTIELAVIQATAKSDTTTIAAQDISHIAYTILKRFDELTAMQYAMQHKLVTSIRRRGRPSTISSL